MPAPMPNINLHQPDDGLGQPNTDILGHNHLSPLHLKPSFGRFDSAAETPSAGGTPSIGSSLIHAQQIHADQIQPTFGTGYIDLVSAALNGRVLGTSDEWFADASNLLTRASPINKPGLFTHTGAWYDGWETRRHNPVHSDWVVIQLGVASGTVKGIEIDTAFFNGNHAPEISLEGCFRPEDRISGETDNTDITNRPVQERDVQNKYSDLDPAVFDSWTWDPILSRNSCGPNQRHAWLLDTVTKPYTHVRLHMYPDGGIARFRLYGTPNLILSPATPSSAASVMDLACAVNGGIVAACSDQHFSRNDNILLPGPGSNMGDGWETRRSRGEHVDWSIVRLGVPADSIERLVIDTSFFRGNYPQQSQVFVIWQDPAKIDTITPTHQDPRWTELLTPKKMEPDAEHIFSQDQLLLPLHTNPVIARWVKLVIIPDGGVMRFRVYGKPHITS